MNDTLVIEYGQKINRYQDDFINKSNETSCLNIELVNLKSIDYVETYPVDEEKKSDTFLTMLVSERVLAKEWLTPEEDKAWGHL